MKDEKEKRYKKKLKKMFYKRQYKINSETFAWLGSAWGLCSFFSQLLLVPFLSFTLGIRDTTTTIIVIIV